jgi:hypothetical protein
MWRIRSRSSMGLCFKYINVTFRTLPCHSVSLEMFKIQGKGISNKWGIVVCWRDCIIVKVMRQRPVERTSRGKKNGCSERRCGSSENTHRSL